MCHLNRLSVGFALVVFLNILQHFKAYYRHILFEISFLETMVALQFSNQLNVIRNSI